MEELGDFGSFLLGLAVAGALLALISGWPRLVRRANDWMGAILFSSLDGWGRNVATASAVLAVFWIFLLAAGFYSPIAVTAPDTLPVGGGSVARQVFAVNIWLLVVLIPLAYGLAEGLAARKRPWPLIRDTPAGLVHLPGLSLALAVLLPWTLWGRVRTMFSGLVRDSYRVSIEADHYAPVLASIAGRLREAGLPVQELPTHAMIRLSRWLLDHLGPPSFRNAHDHGLRSLVAPGVELTVHTGMLDLSATRQTAGKARWALSGHLPPDGFWWTRSHEGREVEAAILGRNGRKPINIPARLAALETDFEEWRALQQEYLLMQGLQPPHRPRAGRPTDNTK
jgi:hypothetical protein